MSRIRIALLLLGGMAMLWLAALSAVMAWVVVIEREVN